MCSSDLSSIARHNLNLGDIMEKIRETDAERIAEGVRIQLEAEMPRRVGYDMATLETADKQAKLAEQRDRNFYS